MVLLNKIESYEDSEGNRIEYEGKEQLQKAQILFRGKNNRLKISPDARIRTLNIRFDCDNGVCVIGGNNGNVAPFSAIARIGQDATITVGQNVSATNAVQISAVEGTSVCLGDDVMIAGGVKIRGDDGHPIFDIHTGRRINVSRSIQIGEHVWLGLSSTILGGVSIGDGSVVGTGAIVTKSFPNNCIVAGVPAKIIRRDIAWERPHLSLVPPYYKHDASSITRSSYWNETAEEQ